MLRRTLPILLFVVLPTLARGTTLTVLLNGSGDYPTIQDGINAAAQGDTILIGPGTYTWTNQNTDQWPDTFRGMIQLLNESAEDPRAGTANDIVIKGAAGRSETFFDAEQRGRVFYSSGRQAGDDNVAMRFTVEGITLQNGKTQGEIATNLWGGATATHLSSPTFRDCRFRDNEALDGGACWVGGQNKALFENCVFVNNSAKFGGAVFCVNSSRNNSIFRNCRFESNSAAVTAGALYVINARVEIEACVFISNTANDRASAIATNLARPLIIRDCFIVGNTGGANTIWAYHNSGDDDGGDPLPSKTVIDMSNTLIASNSAVGIRFDSDVEATVRCTNSYGHFDGNWRGTAGPLAAVAGNGSFKPHLCGTGLRQREVCELSPVLGVNNRSCAGDMGLAVSGCSGCVITDYEIPGTKSQVFAAYPNPFSGSATMDYELNERTHVKITVYDMRGRVVRRLLDASKDAGVHQEEWDGCDEVGDPVASGVYLCEFEAGDLESRSPMIVLR